MMAKAGLHVAIVSGRVSEATTVRAAELGIADVFQDGGARKLPIIERLIAEKGMRWDEVALLGDDLADLAPLRRVGLPRHRREQPPARCGTPPNGRASARGEGERSGSSPKRSSGARREWTRLVDEYCRERGG